MVAERSVPTPVDVMCFGAFSWREFFEDVIDELIDTCMSDDRSLDRFHHEADRLRAVGQMLDEC